jgi:hypothetical protein
MVLALAALAAPPALSLVRGEAGVGSFRMFSEPFEHRLAILRIDASGHAQLVPLASLRAHLGRDARRVIVGAAGWSTGETTGAMLGSALPDVGRLVCALHADAARVSLRLERRRFDGSAMDPIETSVACEQAR